jgi:hypothetical protein
MIENHDFEFGNLNSAASCILDVRPLLDTEVTDLRAADFYEHI